MTDEQLADYERVERSLTNHTPSPEAIERIETIRAHYKATAFEIIVSTPPSRERSLALTHLEDSAMWAVKAIVLEEVAS